MRLPAVLLVPALLAACVDDSAETYRETAFALQFEGKLRQERAPADAPFTNADLIRNFEIIALAREYRREDAALVQETTPSPITRWEAPIRYRIVGGGPDDLAAYAALFDRLSALTNVEIEWTDKDPNLTIEFMNAQERRDFAIALRASGEAAGAPLLLDWVRELRYPCVGMVGFSDIDSGVITGATIVIKDELEDVLREGCIQEEVVQALGLLNDDDRVRPSIFNDDQEFAVMTEHDEFLLRMLYDPRLSPGMSSDEARPLLPEIVADLRPPDA